MKGVERGANMWGFLIEFKVRGMIFNGFRWKAIKEMYGHVESLHPICWQEMRLE